MTATDIVEAAGAIGIVAGAVVALLAAAGGLVKLALGLYRWARRLEAGIAYVEAQMTHNGGSTVRDAIARIEARQTRIEHALGMTEEEDPNA